MRAGAAALQDVGGKQGNHAVSASFETAKENASLLATELESTNDPNEIFDATLNAKKELRTLHGYAPGRDSFHCEKASRRDCPARTL